MSQFARELRSGRIDLLLTCSIALSSKPVCPTVAKGGHPVGVGVPSPMPCVPGAFFQAGTVVKEEDGSHHRPGTPTTRPLFRVISFEILKLPKRPRCSNVGISRWDFIFTLFSYQVTADLMARQRIHDRCSKTNPSHFCRWNNIGEQRQKGV